MPLRSARRPRDPRRLIAILILGLTGGIVLAFLFARGELAGSDARAYWVAVRMWLGGGDPYDPGGTFLPYAYAPWSLYAFLPWGLLPWSVAWFFWRTASIVLFAWSVAWAYERRPLATALMVVALAVPLAANFDTGNVAVLLVLGIFAAQFVGPRLGGFLWAVAAAMKWLPAVLLIYLPPRARLWGLAFVLLAGLLTFATWPQTLAQLQIAFFFPRPIRIDYLLLLWGAVPWLWRQPWPLPVPKARLPRTSSDVRRELRAFFGYG
jgi:hypothetical protein